MEPVFLVGAAGETHVAVAAHAHHQHIHIVEAASPLVAWISVCCIASFFTDSQESKISPVERQV